MLTKGSTTKESKSVGLNENLGSTLVKKDELSKSDITVVNCEIINYVLHSKIEKVFGIVELNTVQAAGEFYKIFHGALFKG